MCSLLYIFKPFLHKKNVFKFQALHKLNVQLVIAFFTIVKYSHSHCYLTCQGLTTAMFHLKIFSYFYVFILLNQKGYTKLFQNGGFAAMPNN